MTRYSPTLMEYFQEARRQGRLESPTHVGVAGVPGETPYIVLHLLIEAGSVADARFQSHSCGATIASGSVLAELIVGRTLHDCAAMTAEDVIGALDGLPPDKRHCAGLAIGALRSALGIDEQSTAGSSI